MRVSIVTGGGRGIGRAIARVLAGPDTFVVVAGRTRAHLESAALDLESLGGQALPVQMDVSNDASVASAVREVQKAVAHVDVLVNNAGIGGGEPIEGSDIDRWRRTIDTNLVGPYLASREIVPLMTSGGRIVNLSSVLGRFGVAGYTAYCASKHGVIGFTRALALELAGRQITVNALCPGWVDTEMAEEGMRQGAEATGRTFEQFRDRAIGVVPIQRIIQPEEVAALVKFLASPAASAITGQTYNICGGQTMD
jgi:ketoreductase